VPGGGLIRSEMALSIDATTACWVELLRGRLDQASEPSAHHGSDSFTNEQRPLSYEYVTPDVVPTIRLPFGRATRVVILMAVPQAALFGDNNRGRTVVGAKFARDFLTSLQSIVR
jgi:hypothetical protein